MVIDAKFEGAELGSRRACEAMKVSVVIAPLVVVGKKAQSNSWELQGSPTDERGRCRELCVRLPSSS